MPELWILDEIGDFGVTARDVVDQLKTFDGQEVTVHLSSVGGDVAQGLGIYNALKDYPGNVTVNIVGVAFSMASGIAMAGDTVVAAENALLMIHEPQTFAAGDADEMNRRGKMLESTREVLTVAYAEKSGLSNDRIQTMMREETWLTAQEALDLGFVDVIGDPVAVAAKLSIPDGLKIPANRLPQLMNLISDSTHEPEQPQRKPSEEEPKTMPENKTDEKKSDRVEQPATLDQLLSLNGADNDFCVDQMKRGATLSQAQNALNEMLLEKLTKAEERATNAEEAAKSEPQKEEGSQDTGHRPLPSDGDDAENSWTDPRTTFEEKFLENKKRYGENLTAYRMTDKKNPGLIEAVRASAR